MSAVLIHLSRVRAGARPERVMARLEMVRRIKERPCKDCRRHFPHYVMEFDHVRGKKRACISRMLFYGEDKLFTEIAKCDVVCSNCHAIRTHHRRLHRAAG